MRSTFACSAFFKQDICLLCSEKDISFEENVNNSHLLTGQTISGKKMKIKASKVIYNMYVCYTRYIHLNCILLQVSNL